MPQICKKLSEKCKGKNCFPFEQNKALYEKEETTKVSNKETKYKQIQEIFALHEEITKE